MKTINIKEIEKETNEMIDNLEIYILNAIFSNNTENSKQNIKKEIKTIENSLNNSINTEKNKYKENLLNYKENSITNKKDAFALVKAKSIFKHNLIVSDWKIEYLNETISSLKLLTEKLEKQL